MNEAEFNEHIESNLATSISLSKKLLKPILLEKSYRSGIFTLTSGKQSDFYIDVKQTSLSANGARIIGNIFLALISHPRDLEIEAVGGMTLGADPIVTAVSVLSSVRDLTIKMQLKDSCEDYTIPAFIVRKEPKGHGTNNYIEGLANMPPGCTVALVEDVVTTGGTLLKVIKIVEDQGFKVGMVLTVVDRQEGGAEALAAAGYELKSIFTREELLS